MYLYQDFFFNINQVVREDEKEKTAGKGFGPPQNNSKWIVR